MVAYEKALMLVKIQFLFRHGRTERWGGFWLLKTSISCLCSKHWWSKLRRQVCLERSCWMLVSLTWLNSKRLGCRERMSHEVVAWHKLRGLLCEVDHLCVPWRLLLWGFCNRCFILKSLKTQYFLKSTFLASCLRRFWQRNLEFLRRTFMNFKLWSLDLRWSHSRLWFNSHSTHLRC